MKEKNVEQRTCENGKQKQRKENNNQRTMHSIHHNVEQSKETEKKKKKKKIQFWVVVEDEEHDLQKRMKHMEVQSCLQLFSILKPIFLPFFATTSFQNCFAVLMLGKREENTEILLFSALLCLFCGVVCSLVLCFILVYP